MIIDERKRKYERERLPGLCVDLAHLRTRIYCILDDIVRENHPKRGYTFKDYDIVGDYALLTFIDSDDAVHPDCVKLNLITGKIENLGLEVF